MIGLHGLALGLVAFRPSGHLPVGQAPLLSGPSDNASGSVVTTSVSTNTANGTLYWVATTTSTPPTKAQVKLGQNSAGVPAAGKGSQTVSTAGVQTIAGVGDGLTAGTYIMHFMHEDGAGNWSAVMSGDGFTTTLNNRLTSSAAFGTGWDSTGNPALSAGRTDRKGGASAVFLGNITASGADTYRQVIFSGLSASQRYEPSVWIKRDPGTPTGTLRVRNPYASASGDWRIAMVDLPLSWTRITRAFPGLTILNEFAATSSGQGGIQFTRAESNGAALAFYLDDPQLELGTISTTYQAT